MSLTQSSLQEIRSIVRSVVEPLASEIKATRNDIKDIYDIISGLQSATITDKEFSAKKKQLLGL